MHCRFDFLKAQESILFAFAAVASFEAWFVA